MSGGVIFAKAKWLGIKHLIRIKKLVERLIHKFSKTFEKTDKMEMGL